MKKHSFEVDVYGFPIKCHVDPNWKSGELAKFSFQSKLVSPAGEKSTLYYKDELKQLFKLTKQGFEDAAYCIARKMIDDRCAVQPLLLIENSQYSLF